MSYITIILFLIVASAVLGGAHYFLYFTVSRIISPALNTTRLVLALVLVFLLLSFFLSTFLARWHDNAFTRAYYYVSSLWLGILTNLFLACLVFWLAAAVSRLGHLGFNRLVLGLVLLVLALGVSAYGAFHAFQPKTKEITVHIPNLPAAWQGKKIVQLSDVHLGLVFHKDFLARAVEQANALNPELVVITGDLIDGMDGNLDELLAPLNDLKAPAGTYFITGNHEVYAGVDRIFAALAKTSVKILQDQAVDINGLKLIGLSYPQTGMSENRATELKSLAKDFAGQPNILLYHAPSNIAGAKAAGVNLQLSGHTHGGQLFPFGLVTKLVYKGYDYGLFREGDFTLYTTSGLGAWGPTMRTASDSELVVITLE